MVTLLGFMFILVNVLFVSLFIPDLVGPVFPLAFSIPPSGEMN
jgi:hypothetical protein